MYIQKLGQLSCLKISEEDIEKYKNSLDEVFVMMDKIQNINSESFSHQQANKKILTDESFLLNSTQIDRQEKHQGILLEETMFLAPKVIKKD